VELERIHSFTIDPEESVLVLAGDPGVGKTALLDASSRMAKTAGMRSLRVTTNEYEAGISFAAVNQCVAPLADHLKDLASPHRSALSIALGLRSGRPAAPLVLASALVMLFGRAASERPLLVIVDDLQWVDRASAGVLALVARRLTGVSVGLLAAIRTGWESNFDPSGLPGLELGPLDDTAAAELLIRSFPSLPARIRQRVLGEAGGNPLALLELPVGLTALQPRDGSKYPAVLPLTERLVDVFGSRVDVLPVETREMLLAAALDTTGGVAVLRLLDAAGSQTEPLRPAERARLVQVDRQQQRIEFRHPLIRSAVVQRSAAGGKRSAHRALAEELADQPDIQAWHLAEATAGPDEKVATLLDEAAERVRRRGDAVGAIRLLLRAADLSPPTPDRGRRMARAAYMGALDADISNASDLLDAARGAIPDRETALLCAGAAGYTLVNGDADIETAHRVVVEAVRAHLGDRRDVDDSLRAALQVLGFICVLGMRPELWTPFHEFVGELSDPSKHLHLIDQIWADPARCSRSDLDELDDVIGEVVVDHRRHLIVAGPAAYVDRLAPLREGLLQLVKESRNASPGQAVIALAALCTDGWLSGNWTQLKRWSQQGLRLSAAQKLRAHDWTFRYYLGLLAAAEGDTNTARRLADEIGRWSLPRGAAWPNACARHLLGFDCLSRGDYEEAYHHFAVIAQPGMVPSHAPHALWVSLDLVEAAVRTGRTEEAAVHARATKQAGLGDLSSRMALLVESANALASGEAAAPELLAGAVQLPSADRWPFDHARVQLLLGESLRRSRQVKAARSVLATASSAFRQLGASAWTARSEGELRATGMPRSTPGGPHAALLTPQEFEIAELAAAGMTNKQIAQRLIMSPRTVSTHLYKIFPKLRVTSRAALRDALIEHGDRDSERV
jgi:DNA-binding CsgD family transcriptional regulator